jgi:hypothetical protein
MTTVASIDIRIAAQGADDAMRELRRVTGGLDDVGKAGKATGGHLDNLLTGVKALAAGFVATQVARFAADVMQVGAASLRAEHSLNALTEGRADEFIQRVGAASRGTVSDLDMMSASARALRFGVVDSAQDMELLTRAARALGTTMGMDTTAALNDLVTGIGRASPMILDNLGLVVKLGEVQEEANRIMAETPGLTYAMAQRQALYNSVIQQGLALEADLGGTMDDAAASTERMAAAVANLKAELGAIAATALAPAIDQAAQDVTSLSSGFDEFVGTIRGVRAAYEQHSRDVASTTGSYGEWLAEMTRIQQDMGAMGRLMLTGPQLSLSISEYDRLTDEVRALQAAQSTEIEMQRAVNYTRALGVDSTIEAVMSTEELTASIQSAADVVLEYANAVQFQAQAQMSALGAAQQMSQIAADHYVSQRELADVYAVGTEMLGQYNLSAVQTVEFMQALGLATGQITQEQINQATGVRELTNLYTGLVADGLMPAAEAGSAYAAALQQVAAGADAQQVALDAQRTALQSTLLEAEYLGEGFMTMGGTMEQSIRTGVPAIEEVQAALTTLSTQQGQININADDAGAAMAAIEAVQGALHALSATVATPTIIVRGGGGIGGFAEGGRVGASGTYLVGEQGPELVQLPSGAYVHDAGQTRSMLSDRRGGGQVVINVTAHDVQDTVAAIQRELRAQGVIGALP